MKTGEDLCEQQNKREGRREGGKEGEGELELFRHHLQGFVVVDL